MIKLKQNKGITLITLILAIIIMLVISSVIIYNAQTGITTRALNNMYNDITLLKDKIDIYFARYGTLPIIKTPYTNVENIKNINVNDNENYYVVDLESLDNITLTYGKHYQSYKTSPDNAKTDIYIINEQSHTIYYVKGIKLDEKTYYTTISDYTKVEIPEVSTIKLKQIKDNIATLKIEASNKSVGIKNINLYKGDTIYKTYEYTDNPKERKQEIIDVTLPFYEETNWYIQVTDANQNQTTSDAITLKNEEIISTKEDLFALAEVVNNGNTLEGKTIKQINDIDLQCSITNKWIPIGNYASDTNKYFAGTYDGKGNKIDNIYIDTTSSYQGLFGYNIGTIKNVGIHTGTIKAGGYSGSIVGENEGIIEKCYNLIDLYCYQGRFFGGIAGIQGQSKKASIIKCYNKGNITGSLTVQYGAMCGIVGCTINNSNIEYSYNTGNITNITSAQNARTAGITDNGGTINACYNTGNITTQMESELTYPVSAGIVGQLHSGEINNCYNTGVTTVITTLTSTVRNGGITGYYDQNTTIKNSYWLTITSPSGVSEVARGANENYEAIEIATDVEMKNITTNLGSDYKEDLNNINNGYPILNWQ